MWIFTRLGFFSISVFEKGKVNIRARDRNHLVALAKQFPKLGDKILTLRGSDYRYRIEAPQKEWVKVATALAAEQTWSNFKNEVGRFTKHQDKKYLHALHEVWGVMYELQES